MCPAAIFRCYLSVENQQKIRLHIISVELIKKYCKWNRENLAVALIGPDAVGCISIEKL